MVKSKKKYFSFFGMLYATACRKINSKLSSISTILDNNIPKIAKLLHAKQLKPVKLYSTNNL